MFTIQERTSGYVLTFGGFMTKVELDEWYEAAQRVLSTQRDPFGVIVDMRTLQPLPADALAVMVKGQQLFRQKGMQRSAVILSNAITTAQFRRLAKESGIYDYERYLNASLHQDWQQRAVDWVKSGIDPDI